MPSAVLGVVLMECGDFAMMRRMLRGIKTRAEWSVGPTGGESACAAQSQMAFFDGVGVAGVDSGCVETEVNHQLRPE